VRRPLSISRTIVSEVAHTSTGQQPLSVSEIGVFIVVSIRPFLSTCMSYLSYFASSIPNKLLAHRRLLTSLK